MEDITPTHIKASTWKPVLFITDDLVERHRKLHRAKFVNYRPLDPEESPLYRDTYARLGVPEGRLLFDRQETPEPDDRTAEGWL